MNKTKPMIIAGPCAAENQKQLIKFAKELKSLKVDAMRASLWKPRTAPGFEGVGQTGIGWLAKIIQEKMSVATEVLLPEHVEQIVIKLNGITKKAPLMLWLGARNQNHLIQKEIASRLLNIGPKNALLMIKNQTWEDEKHWLGIIEHVLSSGFPKKRLLVCHRGFSPIGRDNPGNLRNLPNFAMAMRVKTKSKLPMLLDPSHIGGSAENVIRIIKESLKFSFDGYLIEVHPRPKNALTDSRQQLNLNQLKNVLQIIRRKN